MSDFDAEKQKVYALFEATETDTAEEFKKRIELRAKELEKTAKHVIQSVQDAYGVTLLHAAVSNGNKEVTEFLISRNIDDLATPTKAGDTLLHSAINSNNVEIIALVYDLLNRQRDKKKDPNPFFRKNLKQVTPAQAIIETDAPTTVIDWMLQNAPWEETNQNASYITPLQAAVFKQDAVTAVKIVAWMSREGLEAELKRTGAELPPALVVAGALPDQNASTTIVQAIVDKAGPEYIGKCVDQDGTNVALNAAESGNLPLVQTLIKLNPQAFFVANLNKQTALDVASHPLRSLIAEATKGLEIKQADVVLNPTKVEQPQKAEELTESLAAKIGVRKGTVSPPSIKDWAPLETLKTEANAKFSDEKFEESLTGYSKTLVSMGFNGELFDDEKSNHFAAVILCNMAAVFNKLGDYAAAISVGKLALKFDSNWSKIYWRVATAYRSLNNYIEAIEWIFNATLKEPSNVTYRQLLASWSETARKNIH